MNGSHRRDGVLLLHGQASGSGVLRRAALRDVAPSLMGALGQGAAPWMEGRSLLTAPHAGGFPGGVSLSPGVPSPREEQALRRHRLQQLGYL